MALLFLNPAQAHEEEKDAPGIDLIAGFGLIKLDASYPYPWARLPGVLESGNALPDGRRSSLDYKEVGLAGRFDNGWRALVKTSKHGESGAQWMLEEAWLKGDVDIAEQHADFGAGRQLLPLGLLNPVHAHARDFGIDPLPLRAAINGSWSGDGAQANLELPHDFDIGLGLWQNNAFPGAPAGGPKVVTLRGGWTNGELQLETGLTHAPAPGRALVTLVGGGHTHSLPSCDGLSTGNTNFTCFDGQADLFTLAGRWSPEDSRWWLEGEWWVKRDHGQLASFLGRVDYNGLFNGGWLDFGWQFSPTWYAILRLERGVASHSLDGANADLMAVRAGIANSDDPLQSLGLGVTWKPAGGHRLSAEWHHDSSGTDPIDAVLLRYQFNFSAQLGRIWEN